MKIKIFRGISKEGRKYFYIPAKNYKDANDKVNIYVSFAKNVLEPVFTKNTTPTGYEYETADVDVETMYFGCYKGKATITIAKLAGASAKNDNTFYTSDIPTDIGNDDLPF